MITTNIELKNLLETQYYNVLKLKSNSPWEGEYVNCYVDRGYICGTNIKFKNEPVCLVSTLVSITLNTDEEIEVNIKKGRK